MELPNYLTDLNAMNAAEKTMNDTVYALYCVALNNLTCGCKNTRTCGYTVSATAAQRAEAFCKTLNPTIE